MVFKNVYKGGGAGGLSRGKKNYKGQRRHFTDENELKEQAKKTERELEWRVSDLSFSSFCNAPINSLSPMSDTFFNLHGSQDHHNLVLF